MNDPTKRFTGLAEIYSAARPGYPDEAIDHIFKTCNLTENSIAADVGCGTGISTRLLASRGIKVIGIEPNDDMRNQAESKIADSKTAESKTSESKTSETLSKTNLISYRKGDAESTGLPDHAVQLVLAAQAFHWFKPEPAIAEFCRILSRPGWIALMWNERDSADDCTNEYGELLLSFPETKNVEMNRGKAGVPLLESRMVKDAGVTCFKNFQQLDLNGLCQRAFSSSYAPKQSPDKERLQAGLGKIFQSYQSGGTVFLRYETSVYLAQAV
jgi:SAM-dependent methyltransferase